MSFENPEKGYGDHPHETLAEQMAKMPEEQRKKIEEQIPGRETAPLSPEMLQEQRDAEEGKDPRATQRLD